MLNNQNMNGKNKQSLVAPTKVTSNKKPIQSNRTSEEDSTKDDLPDGSVQTIRLPMTDRPKPLEDSSRFAWKSIHNNQVAINVSEKSLNAIKAELVRQSQMNVNYVEGGNTMEIADKEENISNRCQTQFQQPAVQRKTPKRSKTNVNKNQISNNKERTDNVDLDTTINQHKQKQTKRTVSYQKVESAKEMNNNKNTTNNPKSQMCDRISSDSCNGVGSGTSCFNVQSASDEPTLTFIQTSTATSMKSMNQTPQQAMEQDKPKTKKATSPKKKPSNIDQVNRAASSKSSASLRPGLSLLFADYK
ncbi:hypothetical protein RDWZM_005572 [Blomia tropicalis]|uniref:Uncharacterized protein n=1 Tax=Blomia tropicalis TaxID=40697 RepID=A0A9Q0RMR4_BLOTA|nr:hypothetical protein RDWZM_005572 [Blomia tropicalis]